MSSEPLSFEEAAHRLAPALMLTRSHRDLLVSMLANGDEGIAPPVDPCQRKALQVHLCHMRRRLAEAAGVPIITVYKDGYRSAGAARPAAAAKCYMIEGAGRAKLMAQAEAEPRRAPAPLKLNRQEEAIFLLLAGKGEDWTDARGILACMAGIGRTEKTAELGRAVLYTLKLKCAAFGLHIEQRCRAGSKTEQLWRFDEASRARLATFGFAGGAALAR